MLDRGEDVLALDVLERARPSRGAGAWRRAPELLGQVVAGAREGVMFEEFLFWDNGEFMRQIWLGQ